MNSKRNVTNSHGREVTMKTGGGGHLKTGGRGKLINLGGTNGQNKRFYISVKKKTGGGGTCPPPCPTHLPPMPTVNLLNVFLLNSWLIATRIVNVFSSLNVQSQIQLYYWLLNIQQDDCHWLCNNLIPLIECVKFYKIKFLLIFNSFILVLQNNSSHSTLIE